MRLIYSLLISAVLYLAPAPSPAQPLDEKILPLDGRTVSDPPAITLTWFEARPSRVGSVTVKRRNFMQSGTKSWITIAPPSGPIMQLTDNTIVPGTAYEYQVLRSARDIVDLGYWVTGVKVAARELRGTVHLVVEETLQEEMALRLARFVRDLEGDGWTVSRHTAPRHIDGERLENLRAAATLKEALRAQYTTDPFGDHAIILVGHIPIVASGSANPDGHNFAPHATDLFYAELDGQWQASPDGLLLHNQVPSDFIEMQVGRIDFAPLSGDRTQELNFLKAYFDKNHHWRMGFLGDPRRAYGDSTHLLVERNALRNIVGPDAITQGGHHDVGEQSIWLWGVDFGDHNGGKYIRDYANKAVFTINFGSGKQRFNGRANAMTALLAQPWYTLATGWGGRPAWWLHRMSLGASIGDAHFRTVNNGVARLHYRETMDYYPTGGYLFRNPVWVNLLGDPTARPFPLAPPARLLAVRNGQKVALSWQASPDEDVSGYKIYRSPMGSSGFIALGTEMINGTSFIDTDPQEGARYMVRAYGLKQVHAGSFHTFSQGIFSSKIPLLEKDISTDIELRTRPGEPVALPEAFSDSAIGGGEIYALVHEPAKGGLTRNDTGWIYEPPPGFEGTVTLPFSVSDAWQTEKGTITIVVGNEN